MATIRGVAAAVIFLAAFAMVFTGCEGPGVRPTRDEGPRPAIAKAPQEDVKAVVKGNNAFAVDLYHRLRTREGNIFFSPYSISTALAMTYAGARGETAAEMRKVLHFTLPDERLHPAFAALAANLKPEGCELHIANRLWGQKGYRFLDPFLELTEDCYGARLERLDFAGAGEAAKKTINAWVEEKTRDRVKELLQRGDIDRLTRLVLTNAVYFNGDWASQFEAEATKDAPFTLLDGKQVQVPMMYQKTKFRYTRRGGWQVLELPYAGGELSMFVLLPERTDDLPELEDSLTAEKLNEWLSVYAYGLEVEVFLPRFRMTGRFSLEETLRAMGMPGAFSLPPADFSGMTGGKNLFVSKVIHKAFVEVNERGTEAAAATAVLELKNGTLRFCVDHPFLFLILENRSGSILFLGRVMNPLKAG